MEERGAVVDRQAWNLARLSGPSPAACLAAHLEEGHARDMGAASQPPGAGAAGHAAADHGDPHVHASPKAAVCQEGQPISEDSTGRGGGGGERRCVPQSLPQAGRPKLSSQARLLSRAGSASRSDWEEPLCSRAPREALSGSGERAQAKLRQANGRSKATWWHVSSPVPHRRGSAETSPQPSHQSEAQMR